MRWDNWRHVESGKTYNDGTRPIPGSPSLDRCRAQDATRDTASRPRQTADGGITTGFVGERVRALTRTGPASPGALRSRGRRCWKNLGNFPNRRYLAYARRIHTANHLP